MYIFVSCNIVLLQEKERNAYRLAQENAKRIEEMNQNSRKPRTGISSEDFRTTKPIISNQGMGSGAESEPKMSRFPSKNGVTPENTTGPSDRSSSSSNVPSSSKNEPAVSKISLNRENRKNPRANDKLLKQLINEVKSHCYFLLVFVDIAFPLSFLMFLFIICFCFLCLLFYPPICFNLNLYILCTIGRNHFSTW